ncbi:hypothetical protein N9J72_03025 [Candidatus Gracilibacteria bacterium]|nr:hypothetical protein [Candidatus Gracilibacteria bacterium]
MIFKISRKIYAHIDCDSFFAACEIYRNPALKKKYVCVGRDVTIACCYNAKSKGIKVGTPFWEVKRMLGNKAICLEPDMGLYGRISQRFMNFLREETHEVQVFSIDEAFVDITGIAESMSLSLEEYIKYLQQKIKNSIGIPVSLGVSNTKLRAKIFSKIHKPYGYFIGLDIDEINEAFKELPVGAIPFIGYGYQRRLAYHIQTVFDFKTQNIRYFRELIGKNATHIWFELNGVNSMEFHKNVAHKSISKTRSFNHDMTSNKQKLWGKLLLNIERFFEELYIQQVEVRNIKVFFRTKEMDTYKKTLEFEDYTCDRKVIYSAIEKLFSELYDSEIIYRSTGVFSTDIQAYDPKQLSIFQTKNQASERSIKLESILGGINDKYGKLKVRVGV